ncbi:MAG: hypothetical protein H7315_07815 [Herminiimonas sp.]|nr:hypothetical protein [Herminiimonas sp.]
MRQDEDYERRESATTRPWVALETTYDVEAWIDIFNRDLQNFVKDGNATGYGICFGLSEGGDVYLHTTSEGDVVLDVEPDAQWIAPLISAATRTEPPAGRIWFLPGHMLTQLIVGLSSLIASSRIVVNHDFRLKKY